MLLHINSVSLLKIYVYFNSLINTFLIILFLRNRKTEKLIYLPSLNSSSSTFFLNKKNLLNQIKTWKKIAISRPWIFHENKNPKKKYQGEIIYRVELPDMEEITMIYLENSDADYCKSCKKAKKHSQNSFFIFRFFFIISPFKFHFSKTKIKQNRAFH